MALSITDSDSLTAAYNSVLQNEFKWILLHYENESHEQLSLFAHGSGGLEEMKSCMREDNIFIAFYRQDETDGIVSFLLINYIPSTISGVKRARALVRSRRVGSLFEKHQTTLTVEDLTQLTTATILQALAEPDTAHLAPLDHSLHPMGPVRGRPKPIVNDPMRRSFSETYAPHTVLHHPENSPPKSSNMFSSLLRRKKRTDDSLSDDTPPPTPPKDKGKFTVLQPQTRQMSAHAIQSSALPIRNPQPSHNRPHSNNFAEFAVLSGSVSSDEVVVDISPQQIEKSVSLPPANSLTLPLRGKWAPERSIIPKDPSERARRRIEAQRQREIEERDALKQEEKRQLELKLQKENFLRRQEMEDAKRRASLENELKRVKEERRRKEELEMLREERARLELEERKRVDRERRLEEHRRLEEWRSEQARLAEELAQRALEERNREDQERRKKIQLVEAEVKLNGGEDSLLTGWVTIQVHDSLVWKRRYFKFSGSKMMLYRSPKDINHTLDEVELRGQLRGLKEWTEGYEHLEAIPHSFAVEFKDGRKVWSMFADSEEEKFKLLGLLHHTAGL